jgi:AcrR family transcriptional regulator
MTSNDPAAADLERSSQQWLAWLARETARRQDRPGSALDALWDVLEEWFASDEFAGSTLAAAVAAPPDGRGPAAHAVLVRHRQALRQLLEDLAKSSGAHDPAVLAAQLQVLVDGAISAAAVDRTPAATSGARTLAKAAITAASTG